MMLLSVICTFFITYLHNSAANPPGLSRIRRAAFSFSPSPELPLCTEDKAKKWSYDFHECFIHRKAGDGGQDLNNIVDRILDHSKDCVKNSSQGCRPDFQGFMILMEKVIQQIKDYSEMYLELIHKGRNNIKDLRCIETILTKQTYNMCFNEAFNYSSESEFQSNVEDSLFCANFENNGCSNRAKSDLNNIVQITLNVDTTSIEYVTADPPRKTEPPPRREPPPKKEEPWAWYDYLWKPFEYVWSSIRSFFGF